MLPIANVHIVKNPIKLQMLPNVLRTSVTLPNSVTFVVLRPNVGTDYKALYVNVNLLNSNVCILSVKFEQNTNVTKFGRVTFVWDQ